MSKLMKTFLCSLLPVLAMSSNLSAQRIQDKNSIAWLSSINNIYLSKKISLLAEYSWRRKDAYTNWQQSLARCGVQYNFNNDMSVLAGYGFIITYPYGGYAAGPHHIPEHRFFEQFIWNEYHGRVVVNHRLRLEQRLIGKVDQKLADFEVKDYNYLNRLRYQIRVMVPLNTKKIQPKSVYLIAYDELFIGFGSNVNQNVFDQNRLGLQVGYQISKPWKVEAGFMNQTLQQAALVNGKQVYQYNNGPFAAVYYTLKK